MEKENDHIFHDSQVVAANVGIARKGYHLHCFNVGGKEDCAMINENAVPLWFALSIVVLDLDQMWEFVRNQNQNVVKEAVNAAMIKNVVKV